MPNHNKPRVGREATPTPTPTPSATPVQLGSVFGTINSRIKSTLPDIGDIAVDLTIDEFLDTLKETQRRVIGDMLRRAGISINKLEDIDSYISQNFSGLPVGSFNQFVTALDSQLVYKKGKGTGPSESISITEYGPEQIDAWVDNWLTGEVGRTLESVTPEQAKLLRRAVRDYASSESVTKVTRDKKGRAVTTYSPGVSEAGIQEALKTTAEAEFGPEMERRQAFEFGDLLSKTLGIGSI